MSNVKDAWMQVLGQAVDLCGGDVYTLSIGQCHFFDVQHDL